MLTRILRKSNELFRQYGHVSVSMDDIAKSLGISKKTLYKYIKSKDDLLTEGILLAISDLKTSLDSFNNYNEHPLLRLSNIYLNLLIELSNIEVVHIYTLNKYSSKAADAIADFHDYIVHKYAIPLLKEAKENLCIREEINIHVFVQLRLSHIDKSYLELKYISNGITLKESFLHLVVYQILGICSENGNKVYNKIIEELEVPQ